MDLLQQLATKSGEDYIKGQRESAPDLNNPEEMNQFLQDLVVSLSGGGIGGTIKTGTKAPFDLSKGTLLKRFFEKYSGKSYPRKPVTSQKGFTSGNLDDLFQNIRNLESGGIKSMLGPYPKKPLLTPEALKFYKQLSSWVSYYIDDFQI